MCGKMLRSNRGGPHNKTSTTIRNTSSLFFDKKKEIDGRLAKTQTSQNCCGVPLEKTKSSSPYWSLPIKTPNGNINPNQRRHQIQKGRTAKYDHTRRHTVSFLTESRPRERKTKTQKDDFLFHKHTTTHTRDFLDEHTIRSPGSLKRHHK